MRPLTLTRPKQLIELAGKPILAHIFRVLPDEIDEVILVIGYLGEQIREYFGESFEGRKISYTSQPEKNGTWGALLTARDFVKNEKFVHLPGDDIVDKESIARALKHDLAIIVKEAEDPRRFGVVVVDAQSRVKDFVEKPEIPPSNLVSTSIIVLDGRVFRYWPQKHRDGEYYITDAVSQLARDSEVFAEKADMWLSASTPADLPAMEEKLKAYYVSQGWTL